MESPLKTLSTRAIGEPESTPSPYLTPRQLEVLSWLCEGLPNKMIARRLNISAATVKVHIGSILRELGVSSRLQAVISARGLGLVRELELSVDSVWPGYAAQAISHAADTLGRRAFSATRGGC